MKKKYFDELEKQLDEVENSKEQDSFTFSNHIVTDQDNINKKVQEKIRIYLILAIVLSVNYQN